MIPNDGSGDGLFLSPIPVPTGDPAALSGAAATLTSAQGEIDRSHTTLVTAAAQGGGFVWSGLGATACATAASKLATAYAGTSTALGRGATALRAYSSNLEAAQQSARRANEAVTASNTAARAFLDAQAAAQRTQQIATAADQDSTAADAQVTASPHSPAAHAAAEHARSTASDATSAANEAAAQLSSVSAKYDTDRAVALSLCAKATEQASHATTQAVTAFGAAATELTGMSPKPAKGGAAGVPGHSGHESFWSSFLHGAEHLGEDLVNAGASVGNSMIHDPGGVFALLGGIGLTTISSGGEVLGVGLDATGVGAIAGVPLNAVSAAGIAGGVTLAGAGASSIIRNAAGPDRVTLMQSSGGESGAPAGGSDPVGGSGSIPGPQEFDPQTLNGMDPQQVENSIPSDWTRAPSRAGGGEVFRDPANPGRQIRIMPGYAEGSRPDPLTTGPYAVVSQNGVTVKIPLLGNPTLP
jgi:hypothetical protein